MWLKKAREGAHVVCKCQPRYPQHGRCTLARSLRPLTRPPALQEYHTALMLASERGHTAVVDALLAAGADPKASGFPNLVSGWALVCIR